MEMGILIRRWLLDLRLSACLPFRSSAHLTRFDAVYSRSTSRSRTNIVWSGLTNSNTAFRNDTSPWFDYLSCFNVVCAVTPKAYFFIRSHFWSLSILHENPISWTNLNAGLIPGIIRHVSKWTSKTSSSIYLCFFALLDSRQSKRWIISIAGCQHWFVVRSSWRDWCSTGVSNQQSALMTSTKDQTGFFDISSQGLCFRPFIPSIGLNCRHYLAATLRPGFAYTDSKTRALVQFQAKPYGPTRAHC